MDKLMGADDSTVENPQATGWTSLEQTTRALRTLSAGNRSLLRAKDETALLVDMCKAIVEKGGYRRAGVALAEDDDAKTIRWVTWVGLIDGKAELLDLDWANQRLFTYADTAAGQTAVGMAIRTRAPCVGRDILNNLFLPQYRRASIRVRLVY